jgi:hypothetical protein
MTFQDNTNFEDPSWYARHTDPVTSHMAAAQINRGEVSVAIRDAIVHLLRFHGPLTDAQLEGFLVEDSQVARWITPSGMRTRRKKLERDDILFDTGTRRKSDTGRMAICWGLVGVHPPFGVAITEAGLW